MIVTSELKEIKKEIRFNELIIRLYQNDLNVLCKNIEAFDFHGKLIWVIEAPLYDNHYFDMQIDEENNFLETDGGGGYKYEIDISNGRIIKSYLIK